MRAPISFSARSTWIWRCPPMNRPPRIAARAAPACRPALPARSSRPIAWMRAAASPISRSSSPARFRSSSGALIGNRIYGCDDCQLVCPWNKFARPTAEKDFSVRHGLDRAQLVALFSWSEAQFLDNTRGSAIRRIGYERWLRNVAVALGNAPRSPAVIAALRQREHHPSALVREHVRWALAQHAALPAGQGAGSRLPPAGLKKCRPRRALLISANSNR